MTSFSRETHARATTRPTAGEPVNRTLLDGRPRERHADVRAAVHDAHEPLGQARAREHAARSARPPGTRAAAGLKTTPLPASSAPAIWPSGCANGALPAPITPTTPYGSIRDARALGDRQRAVDAHAPAAEHVAPVLGDPLQRVDRGEQLERRDLRARPALLAGERLLRARRIVDHRLRHAPHVARAVLHPQQRPQRLHLGDGRHHRVDSLGRGDRDRAERRAGRRVARGQLLARVGLAEDVEVSLGGALIARPIIAPAASRARRIRSSRAASSASASSGS